MNRQLLNWVAGGIVLAFGSLAVPGAALAQNSVVNVPPPQIYDYWVSISRQAGGTLVFDGYAPDAATRAGFDEIEGADTNWLKLGSGAPASYEDAVAFGLDILGRLSEGRFAVRGNIVSVSGVAATSDDYAAVRGLLPSSAPQGLILAMAEIAAPKIEPYGFAVTRQANGQVLLSGHVPSPELERSLLQDAGEGTTSILRYGSGQPFTFETAARQALTMVPLLAEGEIRLDGTRWQIAGTPASAEAARAIEAQFAEQNLPEAGWGLSLAAPAAVATAAVPTAPEAPAVPAEPVAEAAVPPPAPEPVATPPAAPAASVAASAVEALAQCRIELAGHSAQNAILFRSGAAILAEGAAPMLDAIATTLLACPEAAINVEGHTDSDGEADLNMALSVARAEAVANALIERGVAPERLYVLGYGESQPIADNATSAGKTQNRRIVVSVRD